MKPRHPAINEMCDLLNAEGFSISRIIYGKHLKFRTIRNGMKWTFIAPMTPSDRRSWLNKRAFIRRKAREMDR